MNNHQTTQGLFFHPGWMVLTITLPQLVLFSMIFYSYSRFSSLLTDEQITLWSGFGIAFLLLILSLSLYCFALLKKKQQVHASVSLFIFLTYIPLLYLFIINFGDLVNRGIPEWMASSTDLALLYPGTFLMPAFIYALTIGILKLTPSTGTNKPIISFLGAALIPLSWYGFFTLIAPLFKNILFDISRHIFSVLLISSTLLFFFLFFRFFFIIIRKNYGGSIRLNYIWRLFVSLVLPLTGLIVYEKLLPQLDSMIHREVHSIIGDFSHPLFLILAIINGIAVIFPDLRRKSFRMFIFGSRIVCFPFTIYFCLVFLPFLPLSLIAVLFFGLGLLMVTPILLFIVQSKVLFNDYKFLTQQSSRIPVLAVIIGTFLILPGGLSLNFYLDRAALHEALNYVFESRQKHEINRGRLGYALNNLQRKNEKTPLISQYYRWLVLDNMSLSSSKISMLRKVFFNEGVSKSISKPDIRGDQSVVLKHARSHTIWEEQSGTYRSKIELEMVNQGNLMAEYATSFTLPAGVWMSDYHLKIGDKKVSGQLMEKKAALWIYNQIKKVRKDPGLVYYLDDNRLALHVFLFNKGETRKTDIELIHKVPFLLTIDNQKINLGLNHANSWNITPLTYPIVSPDGRTIFVSKAAKSQLPFIQRKPYYHFILDFSSNCELPVQNYKEKIERLITDLKLNMSFARITFANHSHTTHYWQGPWKEKLAAYDCSGGFFLDKVIKSIYLNQHQAMSQVYPVIIVVSPDLSDAVLPSFLDQYTFVVPETDYYYELTPAGNLLAHSLAINPRNNAFDKNRPKVRVWPAINNPKAFFHDDKQSGISLIPKRHVHSHSNKLSDQWLNGLTLWGLTKQQLFDRNNEEDWTQLVKLSKQNRILNPYTAFTVLENQAQWEVLKQKEKTALATKKSLDVGKDEQDFSRMSEPPLILVLVGFMILVWILRRRKCSLISNTASFLLSGSQHWQHDCY